MQGQYQRVNAEKGNSELFIFMYPLGNTENIASKEVVNTSKLSYNTNELGLDKNKLHQNTIL